MREPPHESVGRAAPDMTVLLVARSVTHHGGHDGRPFENPREN